MNEAGLAVVAAPGSGAPGACAAPAALLAQDCLQRFAKVESALDWCCGRPAGHAAALLFADSRGELAGVEIRAGSRRVLRPEGALLAWADTGAAGDELAKALREAAPATPAALARVLAPAASGGFAALDPSARRLGLLPAANPDARTRLALALANEARSEAKPSGVRVARAAPRRDPMARHPRTGARPPGGPA